MGFSRESLRQHGAIDLVGVLRLALDLLRSSRAALRMTDLRERLKNAKLKLHPLFLRNPACIGYAGALNIPPLPATNFYKLATRS